MGIGSSSLSIDDKIESLIYYPPNTPDHYFDHLKTSRSKLAHINGRSGKVPTVIVYPVGYTEATASTLKHIVFSHGNGTDIYGMFDYFKVLADSLNVCVVGYDYIGYGLSNVNKPTEANCYFSLQVCIEFIMGVLGIDKSNIYLIGHSLGSGVVIDYVSKNPWMNPVILISPYKSICSTQFDSSLVRLVDKFRSLDKMPNVKCPVKIFHGKLDTLITINHAETLYLATVNKKFNPTWFDEADHNDILNYIETHHYQEVLNS